MKPLKLSGNMKVVAIGSLAEDIIKFRCEMEAKLHALGVKCPKQEPWEDPVDYNNRLLELVEEARERLV